MADIFLSYNEGDRDTVRRLAQALESVGWSVWWDRRIPAGVTWRGVLERELQEMRCMVVVWSSRSVQSEWVCEEAAEGRQAHKLVPVMIESVRPPAGFRELQAADLIGWDGAADFPGLRQLIDDIGRLLGRAASSDAQAGLIPPAPTPDSGVRHRWKWRLGGGVLLALIALGFFMKNWPLAEDLPRPPATKPVASDLPGPKPEITIPSTPSAAASTPAATTIPTNTAPTPASSETVSVKKPAAPKPRCAALLERQQLGETLPASAKLFLQQEC